MVYREFDIRKQELELRKQELERIKNAFPPSSSYEVGLICVIWIVVSALLAGACFDFVPFEGLRYAGMFVFLMSGSMAFSVFISPPKK